MFILSVVVSTLLRAFHPMPFAGPWLPGPTIPDVSTLTSLDITIAGFNYTPANSTLQVFTFPGSSTVTSYRISSDPNGGSFTGFENNFSLQFRVSASGEINLN